MVPWEFIISCSYPVGRTTDKLIMIVECEYFLVAVLGNYFNLTKKLLGSFSWAAWQALKPTLKAASFHLLSASAQFVASHPSQTRLAVVTVIRQLGNEVKSSSRYYCWILSRCCSLPPHWSTLHSVGLSSNETCYFPTPRGPASQRCSAR